MIVPTPAVGHRSGLKGRDYIGLATALALMPLWWCGAPAHAENLPCPVGISRETAERLFAILNHPPLEADCAFAGVETNRSALEATWLHGGALLPAVRVVPRECAPEVAEHHGAFVVDVPPEIVRSCPSVVPLITQFVKQVSEEPATTGAVGSANDPLFRTARALFVGILIFTVALLVRGATRLRAGDGRWVMLGLASFSAALVIRAALPFSMGNWYSEVMPAAGPPPWMRFGPGYFSLQSLLRDAGLWNIHTLRVTQLLIGAAAVPLLLGVLRDLGMKLEAAAATLVLFVFAPFHARLSATTSEHVLGSTLCMGLLLSWMRAARRGDALWFVTALLLFPAVCITRVDMSAQALMVLLWPLLPDRVERDSASHRWPRWWMIAALAVVVIATVVTAYQLIVLPARHPAVDWAGLCFVLRNVMPQFWLLAMDDPGWISLSSVLLSMIGALALAIRRPLLLVRVAATLLIAFGALGRTFMHDELLGARYFLFTIPLFLIAAGYGFEALLALVPHRLRTAAAAAGIAGLALWTGLSAREAYAARYAFQDEYTFARGALAQLPAECTIYQVPIRADALPHDVDCCLDLARSPLVLEFPALHFRNLPDNTTSIFSSPCIAYYEGVGCEITADPWERPGHEFAAQASAYFQRRCVEVHRLGRLELLAETVTASRTTMNFFDDRRPHVRLYRWSR